MKPLIDSRDKCIGCGNCEEVCPKVFKLKDDIKSSVILLKDYSPYEDCIRQAVAECPVHIIRVED